MAAELKLGLIGEHISASRAPALHRLAGTLCGVSVTYDLLVPSAQGKSFAELLGWARGQGYAGVNVTHPYKETACAFATPASAQIAQLGAMNTLRFDLPEAKGFNTDHSGFQRAYRAIFRARAPGVVCLVGSGGVGRAVGFALAALGADEIRCVDLDVSKAEALAGDLRRSFPGLALHASRKAAPAAKGATGLVNCTALGMGQNSGQVLDGSDMAGGTWAFDAVYTPRETGFLKAARAAELQVMSGYELFFWQGVDAWQIFSGKPVDPDALRAALGAQD